MSQNIKLSSVDGSFDKKEGEKGLKHRSFEIVWVGLSLIKTDPTPKHTPGKKPLLLTCA